MKKIFIVIILLALVSNIWAICHSLFLDITNHQANIISVCLYLAVSIFIAVLIYFVLTKNPRTPAFLSSYFIIVLVLTLIEIIYLSYNGQGTKDKMTYFLVYFVLFVYVTKSLFIKAYFKPHQNRIQD